MTKESKVYFAWIAVAAAVFLRRLLHRAGALDVVVDPDLDAALLAGRVAHRGADQIDEVTLDPLAREVVRDREDEGIVVQLTPFCVAEPRAVRGVVESPL